jgi:hypothetical protein
MSARRLYYEKCAEMRRDAKKNLRDPDCHLRCKRLSEKALRACSTKRPEFKDVVSALLDIGEAWGRLQVVKERRR